MSKRLDCPMEGCHASIEGESEDEIMSQAAEHAESAHPGMDLDDETLATIRSAIRDV
jgi:predicted small metal-binding protein